MMQRLSTPRMLVRRVSEDDKTLELQATNADLVLWDRTRVKHRWPKFDEAPFLWMTFLSWAAARRTGIIPPEVKYEEWERDVLEIASDDSDTEGDDAGNPTSAEPGAE